MSMFQSISDMFRPTQQVQQVPAAQQIVQQNNPAADPQSQQQQQATAPEVNPMDAFKDVWAAPADNGGDPFSQPILNVDPAKMQAGLKSLNFMQGVDPTQVQAALQGDQQAFAAVLNGAIRNAMGNMVQLNTTVTEQALQKQSARVKDYIPEAFRSQQLQAIAPTNPALEHPAAQPMLQALRQNIARKNPDLSPAKVAQQAEQYFTDWAGNMSKMDPTRQAEVQSSNKQDAAYDFSNYL